MAAIAIAVTTSAAPGASPTLPASEAEQFAARAAYADCLLAGARSLDDGVSEATIIGLEIAAGCRTEQDRAIAVLSQGLGHREQNALHDRIQGHQADDGAIAVVQVRSAAERR